MLRRHALPFALLLSLGVAACQDAVEPTAPSLDLPDLTPQVQGADPDQLVRQVPGFGGFYLENGRPTIYLTDMTGVPAARGALAGYLRGLGGADLQVRRADYDWQRLSQWFERATPAALEITGAVFVDLDESTNRVLIGVETPGAGASVAAALRRMGIPEGAMIVRQVEPILPMIGLRDVHRPVIGGIQIHFGQYLCTLGFNARSGSQDSFITNSHCTNRQGGTEGTIYYQPTSSTQPSIGTEVHDPVYVRGGAGCPKGKSCRRSDAARVAYTNNTTFTLGAIARTTGANNGSLVESGGFAITAEGSFGVGQQVNKVGRTTGWTQGNITNTCVNTAVSGSKIVQLCQTFVSAGVGPGDSGSPVFGGISGSNVTLAGILWGGNSSGTQFVYSPIANIEQELGALTTQ